MGANSTYHMFPVVSIELEQKYMDHHKVQINGIRASDQLERLRGERDTSMLLSFEDHFAKGCNQQLKISRVSIYASVWSKTYFRSVSESQERFKTQRCVALSQNLKLFMLL